MDKMVIEGGAELNGEVKISGAKNAALPIMTASLLASGESTITNVPLLRDIDTTFKLLEQMGTKCGREEDKVKIDASAITNPKAPYELVKTMRASVLVLGPLVARCGEAYVSLPGGCAIGARPIDLHLKGLEALGAKVSLERGYVHASAKKLKGTKFVFDTVTVTGTENIMMAAVLAEGTTVLENSAREPEVSDLANALCSMGAQIEGIGTDRLVIHGVESLKPMNNYRIIEDRIEAGTFMSAVGITGGEIFLRDVRREFVDAVALKLQEMGVEIKEENGGLRVRSDGRLKSADVRTQPYPGFPTDMQAQVMALLAVADGLSVVTETIFENRFMHVQELNRLGADIVVEGHSAVVRGVEKLEGAPVMATDLRASACLIIAGLKAEGRTEVSRIYHLDRGYERIEKKLQALGARIWREKE